MDIEELDVQPKVLCAVLGYMLLCVVCDQGHRIVWVRLYFCLVKMSSMWSTWMKQRRLIITKTY